MRAILFLMIMLSVFKVEAACDDVAELHTKKFDIYISDGGCAGDTMLTYSAGNKSGSVPFYKECAMNDKGFSCHTNGSSPLAGATYKLVKHGKSTCNSKDPNDPGFGRDEPGYRYVCVKGCESFVPQYLEAMEDCA